MWFWFWDEKPLAVCLVVFRNHFLFPINSQTKKDKKKIEYTKPRIGYLPSVGETKPITQTVEQKIRGNKITPYLIQLLYR